MSRNRFGVSVRTTHPSFRVMLPTKSTEDGQKVLGTYSGIAVVDGYAVYEVLARAGPDGYAARAGPQFRLAHCWAHVKRKFDEASEHYQPTSLVVRETRFSPAKPSFEDSVLLEQVDDSGLLVTLEPTSDGDDQQGQGLDRRAHDRGF